MKNTVRQSQIEKLPVWAKSYIKTLELERSAAVRTLNEMVDSQKASPVFVDRYECLGESSGPTRKRQFIQSTSVDFDFNGILLNVRLSDGKGHDAGIHLQWSNSERLLSHIAFIPLSFQKAVLIKKNDMR